MKERGTAGTVHPHVTCHHVESQFQHLRHAAPMLPILRANGHTWGAIWKFKWRVCNPVTYQRMARVAGNADMARTCCVWAAILPLCRSTQPTLCRWVFFLLDAGCVLVRTAPVSPAPVSHCGRWVRAQATVGCRLLERSLFPIKEGSQSS